MLYVEFWDLLKLIGVITIICVLLFSPEIYRSLENKKILTKLWYRIFKNSRKNILSKNDRDMFLIGHYFNEIERNYDNFNLENNRKTLIMSDGLDVTLIYEKRRKYLHPNPRLDQYEIIKKIYY